MYKECSHITFGAVLKILGLEIFVIVYSGGMVSNMQEYLAQIKWLLSSTLNKCKISKLIFFDNIHNELYFLIRGKVITGQIIFIKVICYVNYYLYYNFNSVKSFNTNYSKISGIQTRLIVSTANSIRIYSLR